MRPHLRVAFARSVYAVAGLALRPGLRSLALARWMAAQGVREAWLITADNPMARRLPPARNAARRAALQRRLAAWPHWPAVSTDARGGWAEHQLTTTAQGGRVRRLARLFRQAAVLRLRRLGRPAVIATC